MCIWYVCVLCRNVYVYKCVFDVCVCVCVLCRNVMCINVYLMCVCVCVCIVYECLCV